MRTQPAEAGRSAAQALRAGLSGLKEALTAYGLLTPAVVLLLAFTVLPGVYSVYISLRNTSLLGTQSQFIGLQNYLMVWHSQDFWHSVAVTAYFAAGTTIGVVGLSLVLALALGSRLHARGLFRTGVLLPYVTPVVATSVVWLWIFNPTYGLANYLLELLHLPASNWLVGTNSAMPALIIYSIWHELGFTVLIFLGGLSMIPEQLRQAMRIDGASAWREFWSLTWPLISPTTLFVFVITVINAFRVFTQVYILTPSGGPQLSTAITGWYVYQEAFYYMHMGYASAVTVVLFLIVFTLTMLQLEIARRFVFYQ